MKLTITHNGYHGQTTRTVRGTLTPARGWSRGCGVPEGETVDGFRVDLPPNEAEKFRCRMSDCKCGEGLAQSFWVRRDQVRGAEVSVSGKFPRR